MRQVLHVSSTMTGVTRRAIQGSKESLKALTKRHGVIQKTVVEWRKRSSTADLLTRPEEATSTTLGSRRRP